MVEIGQFILTLVPVCASGFDVKIYLNTMYQLRQKASENIVAFIYKINYFLIGNAGAVLH
jgi:hypothetical protein